MIPEVLFLALFCTAHVQGRPSSVPDEHSQRVKTIFNNWNNLGNTNYLNDHFSLNERGNGNADLKGDRDVFIVLRRPELKIMVATHQIATNDNANNISVHHRTPSSATVEIATAEPVIEQRTRKPGVTEFGQTTDGVVKLSREVGISRVFGVGRPVVAATGTGRPASSLAENPDRVVNTWNDVSNTDYTTKNFSTNESGNDNTDVNGAHKVLIVGSPPEVNKKVETFQDPTNDNVMEGRPASLPRENSGRNEPIVYTTTDVGNTGNVNENFNADEIENGNADINGSHKVDIVDSPPEVDKKVETSEEAANDNANNISVHRHALSIVTEKVATTKPAMKRRPASLPHENSGRDEPIVYTTTDVGNTGNVNENFNADESENGNADVNGSHKVDIVDSPPEVNKKVETYEEAANDNANNIPVHQHDPSIVTKKIATARPVTEQRTRKPPVEEFADTFGQALGDVVEDNVYNVGREVESVFDVGRSVAGAAPTILDVKEKLVLSVPRVVEAFLEFWERSNDYNYETN